MCVSDYWETSVLTGCTCLYEHSLPLRTEQGVTIWQFVCIVKFLLLWPQPRSGSLLISGLVSGKTEGETCRTCVGKIPVGKPRRDWRILLKRTLKKQAGTVWTKFNWLNAMQWRDFVKMVMTFRLYKRQGIWLAKGLSSLQKELCSYKVT
jgi:hypothetical protein